MPTITNAVVTFYCACTICCGPGNPARRTTANGVRPVVGRTIAAPRSVPFGLHVKIQYARGGRGVLHGFVVEDRTARRYDGRWDIFVRTHAEAKRLGKQQATITWTSP